MGRPRGAVHWFDLCFIKGHGLEMYSTILMFNRQTNKQNAGKISATVAVTSPKLLRLILKHLQLLRMWATGKHDRDLKGFEGSTGFWILDVMSQVHILSVSPPDAICVTVPLLQRWKWQVAAAVFPVHAFAKIKSSLSSYLVFA